MNKLPIRRTCTALIPGLLAATLWLTGCANNAKVSGQWLDGAAKKQTYKAVLLVGLTPDLNARCAFEHFLARHLQTAQTEAIASCDVMDRKQPLTRELVEAAVADQQIDAVLTTILVSKDWTMKEGGSRDTRGSAQYKATDSGWATGYYGWYGVPVVYGEFQSNATSMTMHGEVEVRSRLFETRGKTAVYEMLTKAKKVESTDVALATLTTAIADELRDAGLTR
ncbi:MAG TPA: hypothetical protein VF851_02185 [Steroidobacteraceae bacterium]